MHNEYHINEEDIAKIIKYLEFEDPDNANREYAIQLIESMQISSNEIARSDEALAEAIRKYTQKKG
ncbi:hypothetical protein KC968_04350 [Candidatus Saccharibacteria bacterium]|nr:hypothetical protein [Candidatus Saccharibacteria bacterium]